ncbi:hypothetical protein Ddc_16071 [Ditylenchus destructor]|nr:hypothetical protein Ddc_16071 [Ditylenchus destructor]
MFLLLKSIKVIRIFNSIVHSIGLEVTTAIANLDRNQRRANRAMRSVLDCDTFVAGQRALKDATDAVRVCQLCMEDFEIATFRNPSLDNQIAARNACKEMSQLTTNLQSASAFLLQKMEDSPRTHDALKRFLFG